MKYYKFFFFLKKKKSKIDKIFLPFQNILEFLKIKISISVFKLFLNFIFTLF